MMRSPKPQHTLALSIIEKPSISKGAPIWFGNVYIYNARMIEYWTMFWKKIQQNQN
jgi:hypothetical protein